MADLFRWDQDLLSAEAYDELLIRLEEAGAGSPRGRLYHVCYGRPDRFKIVDVWDSPRHFQEFAETLMPILMELGGTPLEPDVWPVYNITKQPWTGVVTPGMLLVRFDPPGMSTGQYEEIVRRVAEAGYGEPPERLYHVCYREDSGLHVISVWHNAQAFRAWFEQVLRICLDPSIPGVALAEPVIEDVHRIIDGSPLLPPTPPAGQAEDPSREARSLPGH